VLDVVITHMQYDHAGNIALFPRARFHVQDAEMAFCTGRSMTLAQQAAPFELQKALVTQLSTFPLGTSSGGFTYTLDPSTGAITPASEMRSSGFAQRFRMMRPMDPAAPPNTASAVATTAHAGRAA
jgi:hypothetical protein